MLTEVLPNCFLKAEYVIQAGISRKVYVEVLYVVLDDDRVRCVDHRFDSYDDALAWLHDKLVPRLQKATESEDDTPWM